MQRLAQLHGDSIDVLQLNACLADAQQQVKQNLAEQIAIICQSLECELVSQLSAPDPVYLPLLCYTEAQGWGVVIDQDPSDFWLIDTESGVVKMQTSELTNGLFLIRFNTTRVRSQATVESSDFLAESFLGFAKQTIKQYRPELIEAASASLFIGFLALATSMFSMQVYDRVIPTRSDYTLVILSLGVLLTILIELAMKFARSKLMDFVVVGVDGRLSREIFHRLLKLRVDQLPTSVGSLAGQLRGYEQIRSFYTSSTLFSLIDLPLGIVFLLVMAAVGSPWVALVPFVFGLGALYLGISTRKKINELATSGAAFSNMKTGLLVEAVEGVETIKAGSGAWKFLSRWISVNTKTIESDLKMRGVTESVGYLSAMIQQISYACLVIVGSLVVMQGQMTMGALIACSILSGRVLAPVLALPGLLVQHAHAMAALKGLESIYALKTDTHGIRRPLVPDQIHGHFRMLDAKFAYGKNPAALVISKLEIKPGEHIAILGPIGAGKSTLLRLLSGLYVPQEGQVLLDGLDLSHISRQVLSQHIGYLQQDHRLFQGTLRENLLIGMPDPGDGVLKQAMERTGMINFVASHPMGLDRPIMEGGKGLSGGQRQLVAFTRLILCNPEVLLLDEPTATMDDEQERRCIQVLAEQAKAGKTLVVVTHKPSILPLVSRIIIVVGNSVVLDGPRDAVLQQLAQRSAAPTPAVN
mgnify:CR=1 FL=1